jgi:hypothetical protein
MLILAIVFRCLDPLLTVAACLSSRPIFVNPMDKREEAATYTVKFRLYSGVDDIIELAWPSILERAIFSLTHMHTMNVCVLKAKENQINSLNNSAKR